MLSGRLHATGASSPSHHGCSKLLFPSLNLVFDDQVRVQLPRPPAGDGRRARPSGSHDRRSGWREAVLLFLYQLLL